MPILPDWSQSAHSYVTALALAKASQAAYCLADYSPGKWGREYGFAITEVATEKNGMYAFAATIKIQSCSLSGEPTTSPIGSSILICITRPSRTFPVESTKASGSQVSGRCSRGFSRSLKKATIEKSG